MTLRIEENYYCFDYDWSNRTVKTLLLVIELRDSRYEKPGSRHYCPLSFEYDLSNRTVKTLLLVIELRDSRYEKPERRRYCPLIWDLYLTRVAVLIGVANYLSLNRNKVFVIIVNIFQFLGLPIYIYTYN